MERKKFKDRTIGKVLTKLLDIAIDIIPLGTSVKKGVKGVFELVLMLVGGKKNRINQFDRDGDGRVTIKDFTVIEIAGGVVGLVLLVFLVGKGYVDLATLKEIVVAMI